MTSHDLSAAHQNPHADSHPKPANSTASSTPLSADFWKKLSRDTVCNQLLFTAGYSLTSGGFISYFAADLGASTSTITWILVLPELIGMLAILTPLTVGLIGNKKRLFFTNSLIARLFTFLIPLASLIAPAWNFPILLTGLIAAGLLQAIAYTAYLSWLSDLAPQRAWGRFFARRNMAHACVLLIVPYLAALLRDRLRRGGEDEQTIMLVYVGVFCLGNLLQLLSLLPLLKWPGSTSLPNQTETPPIDKTLPSPLATQNQAQSSKTSLWLVIGFCWWLAFFQGLTQTAFFLQGYRELKVGLSEYYALTGLMYLLQMLMTYAAGQWGDRYRYRKLLMGSTFLTGFSLIFWLFSLNGNWLWLWGAYAMWGLFGAVNLSLQNLVLSVSPRHKNTLSIALYRFGAGGIAGLSGLWGGYWLNQQLMNSQSYSLGNVELSPYFVLFFVSFIGRILAPLWLVAVQEPESQAAYAAVPSSPKTT